MEVQKTKESQSSHKQQGWWGSCSYQIYYRTVTITRAWWRREYGNSFSGDPRIQGHNAEQLREALNEGAASTAAGTPTCWRLWNSGTAIKYSGSCGVSTPWAYERSYMCHGWQTCRSGDIQALWSPEKSWVSFRHHTMNCLFMLVCLGLSLIWL